MTQILQEKKLLFIVLCMLVAFTVLLANFRPVFADAADEKETIDYILILDCTVRAVDADAEDVRKAAAKMFVDLIPVDNARVAVFKIGDRDVDAQYGRADKAKSYQLRQDEGHVENALYRMQCVYQLWDFDQPISNISQREELKSIIDDAYVQKQGGFSDTHCAAYAAIDTLKYWNSKNACILLVSEEFTASYNEHLVLDDNGNRIDSDHTMWDDIRLSLSSNSNWIVNWVDLGNGTPEIRDIINDLCIMNGGEACYDFSISKLPEMIATIVSKYTGSNEEGAVQELDEKGNADIKLPDFVMLSEANVVVTGDGVESVSVTDGDDSQIEKPKDDIWFSTNYDPQDKTRFLYSAVKMIRPSSGSWSVNVKGKAGTQVYVQTIHTLEPDILLKCNYQPDEDGLIGVGTNLQFVAVYQYAGEDLRCGSDAYEHYLKGAKLYYTHSSNPDKKEDISNTLRVEGEQYVSDFTVTKRGTYTFYFSVSSNDFKSGIRNANSIENITVSNHTPSVTGSIDDIDAVAVGSHLDAVRNIVEHFSDEDQEELTYRIECKQNGRVVDEENRFWTLTEDGFLSVTAPGSEGEFVFSVFAEDSNGAQSEPVSFVLKTVNDAPRLITKTPIKVRMIVNAPQFLISLGLLPEDECQDYGVQLDTVFTDPEGLPLEFVIDTSNVNNTDGEAILSATIDKTTASLNAVAICKGKATATVTAIDSSNTTEIATFDFNVRQAGDVLFERYWWFPTVIAAIILIVIALNLSKRVRGSWNVEVNNACSHDFVSLPSSRDRLLQKTKVSLRAIAMCAVRKEDCLATIDMRPLNDKVVVFKGKLSLGKGIRFVYTPVAGITARIEDSADALRPGKNILKRRDTLIVECVDANGAAVLIVRATLN